MKYLQLLFLSLLSVAQVWAQPVSGCDGQRYVQQVFAQTTKTTVPYGANVGAAGGNPITLYMDVYTPVGDSAALRPAIVLAHGGTFITGDKADMAKYCIDLAKRGYVAVSVQYRLYPVFQLGFPDSAKIMRQAIMAMGDMKAAIRALRVDAAGVNQFKVHPNWIFCGGYSAGAVSALHVAQLDTDDPIPAFILNAINEQGGIDGSTGDAANRAQTSEVKAVMSLSGGLYTPDWIDANDKPMFSIHGTADDVVYYTSGLAANLVTLHGSGNLHQKADQVGLQNKLKTVNGGGHTDIYSNASYAPVLKAFIDETCINLHNLFCTPLSAAEPGLGKSVVRVHPNPSSGQVRIEHQPGLPIHSVRVYSAFGKCVLTSPLSGIGTLDLAALPGGMYWIECLDARGARLGVASVVKE